MNETEMVQTISKLKERVATLEQRQYLLVYFQGTKQDEKAFYFSGGLRDAINEGRRHCLAMGYRFGAVRPHLVDLKHQERLKATDPDWNESIDESNHIGVRKNKADVAKLISDAK